MTMCRILVLGALVIGAATMGGANALADFVEIDDFDNLTLGPIDDQNGWIATNVLSAVGLDPKDGGNKVLTVVTTSTYLFHGASVPEGEARMLFLRFRYEDQLSVSFGMSEYIYPDQFGNFESELSLTSSKDDLRINDGGTYEEMVELEVGHWYNCWLYVDNGADVTSVWLHDRCREPATAADRLVIDGRTEFPFRRGTRSDLKNVFIKTGGGNGVAGPLLVDDIHIQNTDSIDLSYPTKSLSGVAPSPARLHLRGAWPNPFNPQTTIGFTLDQRQSVELAVHDLSGRLVRLLDVGERDAGSHAVPWDGCDHAGTAVASGVYLVRLQGRQEVQSAKLVLAR